MCEVDGVWKWTFQRGVNSFRVKLLSIQKIGIMYYYHLSVPNFCISKLRSFSHFRISFELNKIVSRILKNLPKFIVLLPKQRVISKHRVNFKQLITLFSKSSFWYQKSSFLLSLQIFLRKKFGYQFFGKWKKSKAMASLICNPLKTFKILCFVNLIACR